MKKVSQSSSSYISQHGQAGEKLQRKNRIQSLFNQMLNISMKPYSLTEMLEHILEPIDSISWLALQSKGVVFLTEDKPNVLFLKTCRNVPEELRTLCSQVQFGRCICGKTALTREIQFISCVDEHHEITYKGMPPHGHYCIPILFSDKLLGVLNLYTKKGHRRKKEDDEFLLTMTNVLGGIIERKKAEEELDKHRQHLRELVRERTAKLTRVTENLKKEIAERKQIEETLQQKITEMTAIHTLSRQINTSLTLTPVVKSISEGIMDTIAADLALIFLRKGNKLILKREQSKDGNIPSEIFPVHRLGECLCGLACSKGKPQYSYNIHSDPHCTLEECKKAGFQSFAALPLKIGKKVIGVLGLASATARDFKKQAPFLETISNEIAIALRHALLYEERKQTVKELKSYQKKLQSLASELSLTEERERRQIATELHDYIGQSLAISKIKLKALQKKGVSGGQEQPLKEILELIEQAIKYSRSLMFELSPPMLYDLGLESALEWLTEQTGKQHGISVLFKDDKHPKPLDDEVRILLFQTVRELLTNVVKHGQASNAEVIVQKEGNYIRIDVNDDGIGFDVSDTRYYDRETYGFGLFNIRERLTYLGGGIQIKSQPGKGTSAIIIAPLKKTTFSQRAE